MERSSEFPKEGYINVHKKNHPGEKHVYHEDKLNEIDNCGKNRKVQGTTLRSEKKNQNIDQDFVFE